LALTRLPPRPAERAARAPFARPPLLRPALDREAFRLADARETSFENRLCSPLEVSSWYTNARPSSSNFSKNSSQSISSSRSPPL